MTNRIYITLKWTATGWLASFQGGDMPQNQLLPLPWTAEATFPMVKRDLEQRFPGCFVSGSLRLQGEGAQATRHAAVIRSVLA